MPFDIPDNWTWIRLGNLVNIQTGASFKKEEAIQDNKDGYIRVLRGGNILPFKYLFKPDDLFIPVNIINESIKLKENDLITPAVTSLENIGKVAVIDVNIGNTTAGGFVYIFRPFFNDIYVSTMIMDFMSSSLFQKLMKEITKKSGQAFYNMNKERLKDIYFPLPPLEEQQRIVNKINSFEPLIQEYDSYEKKLTELEADFPERLKKSILQYAIEGKLVKQDPNDEPASVLLERIKAEKEALIKAGKIKRDKNESYIYQGDDKNYYEKIIGKWVISKLKDVGCIIGGGTPRTDNALYWNGDILWATPADMSNKYKYISETKKKITLLGLEKSSATMIKEESIIMSSRAPIGYLLINKQPLSTSQGCKSFSRFSKNVLDIEYLYYYLNAVIKDIQERGSGTTFKEISGKEFGETIVLIPPINEQIKIANKIKKLDIIL